MPRGRHFFGRGFWKRGYWGIPFSGGGGGRGRTMPFYRPVFPYMTGPWMPPYVNYYPPAAPSYYIGGNYPPMYSGYGGIPAVVFR